MKGGGSKGVRRGVEGGSKGSRVVANPAEEQISSTVNHCHRYCERSFMIIQRELVYDVTIE